MKCPSKICSLPPQDFFLFGARLAFGSWLFFVGLLKWINGATGFIEHIEGAFSQTFLPAPSITLTAWLILFAEPLLGLALLIGYKPRAAWTLTALLMFMLLFGQTVLQNGDAISSIWHYLILAIVCAAFSQPETKTCCNHT